MNILIIARVDHSGAGYALMEAINKTTNHKCRAISYKRNKLLYPYDILNPTPGKLAEMVRWADILNIHDEGLQFVTNTKKPVVTTYHGSWYRSQHEKINARDKKRKFVQTALTIDLTVYGPKWIGRAIEPLPHNPRKDFTVVHCPTQRHRKGTALVLKAFQDLDVNLLLIEKKTHAECIKLKSQGHVLIDQVGAKGFGYGTNALEAWSMGMPVISSANGRVLAMCYRKFNTLPWLQVTNKEEIKEEVLECFENEAYRNAWAEVGKQFIDYYHSPENVARKFIECCERA